MIKDPNIRTSTLTELAALASYAGDADRVDILTETIIDLSAEWKNGALRELAATVHFKGDGKRFQPISQGDAAAR